MSTPALTPEQLKALDTYAFLHGRTWKTKLNTWWQGGYARDGVLEGDKLELYRLRNTHGPTWLSKFRFPPMSACCDAPVVKAEPPFESLICSNCSNMTTVRHK